MDSSASERARGPLSALPHCQVRCWSPSSLAPGTLLSTNEPPPCRFCIGIPIGATPWISSEHFPALEPAEVTIARCNLWTPTTRCLVRPGTCNNGQLSTEAPSFAASSRRHLHFGLSPSSSSSSSSSQVVRTNATASTTGHEHQACAL